MDIIFKYFPDINDRQREQFGKLFGLYSEWNSKINVISRKDIENLYEHHILHSLSIAKIIKFSEGTRIMDIGTGGGLPGIPLAILFPDANFYLTDSIGKKIKVAEEVIKATGLTNVIAEQIRAEQVQKKFDFIVSRAVSDIATIYEWTKNKIEIKNSNSKPQNSLANGLILLKGGDLNEETNPFLNKITIYNISSYFEEKYFEDKKIIYLKR